MGGEEIGVGEGMCVPSVLQEMLVGNGRIRNKNLKSWFLYRQYFLCLCYPLFLPMNSMKPTESKEKKSLAQQRSTSDR